MALILAALLVPAFFIPVQAQQSRDPEIETGLAMMNRYRGWLGLAPMSINPSLQAAAEAHAAYYRLNYGDPNLAGMGLHLETPGRPGFTGESMRDRARAQGYEGSVNENAGLSGSMISSIDWFMDTINHRLPIIDPRYTDVGMATVNDGDIVFEVIMFGMPEYAEYSEPKWAVWPPDGTTGVGRSFWGEAPNPFPGATFPTGLPITMSYHGEGGISLDTWSISANGVELPSFGSVGTGFLSGRAALITAAEPLEYGTTYTVRAAGTAGGEAFARTWSFTTKQDDTEDMARGDDQLPVQPPAPTATAEPTSQPSPTATVAPTATAAPSATPTEEAPAAPPVTAASADSPLPSGLSVSPLSVQSLWMELDGPLYNELETRSWMLGMDVWSSGDEPYLESPDGSRDVYYFDKARVEIGSEQAEKDPDLLTAGLLVRDMILGSAQVGDNAYTDIGPAAIPLAGDPLEFNENAPTYASLAGVATVDGENQSSPRFGQSIVETISRSGAVGENSGLAGQAVYGSYNTETGHNVAVVFENYFETLPVKWWEVVGLPVTEPYWARVMVSGEPRWVLVQAFERRLLTFTPSNAPEWQVEMGNVGRHYYTWRYGIDPPGS
ncbi:MAG: CAP domain-containing protein [Thermomicrobiales bacterium]